MRIGVALPQTDIGGDPETVTRFGQAAEATGYHHLALYDHVLGADVATRPDWSGPFTSEDYFHDVFVLLSYLAARTEIIELSPQILILPQRQTALVAKQAASVDVLSKGRLRLGVGIGWNQVEYECLNESFSNRGRRSEEQLEVLKQLWSEPTISFAGRWHSFPGAGINPRPVQQPMPVWLGGKIENIADRVAKYGDGWIASGLLPDRKAADAFATLREAADRNGRDPDDVGIDAWVSMRARSRSELQDEVGTWKELGVTHLTLNTAWEKGHHERIIGRDTNAHVEAIEVFYDAVASEL